MNPVSKSLRIVLAIGIYEPEHGGASDWLQNYAAWLTTRGHRVCVVCERAETSAAESCDLLTLPTSQHTKNSWKRAAALQNLAKDRSADIVHDTGCLPASDVFHPLMGSLIHNWRRQLRAFPPMLRFRRFWHVRLWRDVRLQWQQRRQHRILVACSKRVAADFAQLGCKNSIVIHNGIREFVSSPPEIIQQLRRELGGGDRLLALATATNFYLKGVMTLLRALSYLDAETRKKFLVIVTGHNQDGIFQQEINRRGLHDCCRLLGWVKNIDYYYSAADIFLHPTYHDAGSLSTLKALASGCAVVASRFDGSADFISDGINGLILNQPGDAEELARILQRLLDAGLRNQLSASARLLAPSFDQDLQFQQLEALYFDLLSGKIPPA
ncbi:MAG TPA: glycosyltransferase family 4 protein [Candidatus Aquilonibacter sp.]|nr:glycosyltransferase family 4 protein [Candidatus Aquilonibacter sp.]